MHITSDFYGASSISKPRTTLELPTTVCGELQDTLIRNLPISLRSHKPSSLKMFFCAEPEEPMHHVVFCAAYKGRISTTGRRRGMKVPYFIETTTRRQFPQHWRNNPGRGILGPNAVYSAVNIPQSLRQCAPADTGAHGPSKNLKS